MKRKVSVQDLIPRITYDEWLAKGRQLFGENFEDWAFECSVCHNVAKVIDYKAFKGASPNDAYFNCIGRFTGTKNEAFSVRQARRRKIKKPCNYTMGGLFTLPGVIVIFEDGTEHPAFAFAKVKHEQGK